MGIDVSTADKKRYALSSLSRYSKNFYLYPSPKDAPIEFIRELTSLVKKHKHDVLMPVHSEDTYLIAKYKSHFDPFIKVPLHDYSSIMAVNNKGSLMQVAGDLGIPIPNTYYIEDLGMLSQIADEIEFPAVIKLRETSSSIGLSYVNSKEELISKYKETILKYALSPSNYPLIQEYVEGDGYGVSVLFNQGDLRAKFTHKRLREYPISGGPSTYRISVKEPKMEDIATRLLEYFNWHGVAMVEFKMGNNNNPVLMEVNPRFWGSLNQAIRSGVDFPYLLYKMALDGDVKSVLNYDVGVKTKNLLIDNLALFNYMIYTRDARLLKEFISLPSNDDVLSLIDFLPILSFIRTGVGKLAHSGYKK
ncbi:ATP-grasp domain-containing protein [Methanothrix sp.]|uniref:carboxylate--amine ligase n=1 Tax=Methanothrix sp. TaxID=90426 RepID=UPI001BD5093E